MRPNLRMIGFAIGVLLWMSPALRICADDTPSSKRHDTLQHVLDSVHRHVVDDDWHRPGWHDDDIETWLEKVTAAIAGAAQRPDLKLPVRFQDVAAADRPPDNSAAKALIVGRNVIENKARLRGCIVLSDGNVEVDSLDGCIVIARGVVAAAHSTSSLIVAGAYISIASDGERRSLDKAEKGSLILTRGWATIGSISGSIIAASEGVSVGSTIDGGVFINATLVLGRVSTLGRKPQSVKVRDLPLGEIPEHELSKTIAIVGVIYPQAIDTVRQFIGGLADRDSPRPIPTGLVVRFDGRRYVLNRGEPVRDQRGNTVNQLSRWQLSYLDDDIAIFSSEDADAVIRVDETKSPQKLKD